MSLYSSFIGFPPHPWLHWLYKEVERGRCETLLARRGGRGPMGAVTLMSQSGDEVMGAVCIYDVYFAWLMVLKVSQVVIYKA